MFNVTKAINALEQECVKKTYNEHAISTSEIDSILDEFSIVPVTINIQGNMKEWW